MSFHSRRTLDTNSKIMYPYNRIGAGSEKMGVTALVSFAKSRSWSFFSCMAYILTTAINTVEEIRIVDGKPVIYDEITPSYTVMTEAGCS